MTRHRCNFLPVELPQRLYILAHDMEHFRETCTELHFPRGQGWTELRPCLVEGGPSSLYGANTEFIIWANGWDRGRSTWEMQRQQHMNARAEIICQKSHRTWNHFIGDPDWLWNMRTRKTDYIEPTFGWDHEDGIGKTIKVRTYKDASAVARLSVVMPWAKLPVTINPDDFTLGSRVIRS